MPRSRRTRTLALAAILTSSTAACRDAAAGFGPTPAAARANGSSFFAALARRFTDVQRTPKFHTARSKLGKQALTPSKIWGDTAVWTSAPSGTERLLSVDGRFTGNRYVLDARPTVHLPDQLGGSRHLIRLARLGDDEYEWATSVDMAMGPFRAEDFAHAFAGLLASAAGRPEHDVRADYRAAAPRATAALGRLVSIDTIRAVPGADGASTVTLIARLHPDRLRRAGFPAFAEYVEKYIRPASYHVVLRDRSDARWLDATASGNRFSFRLRTTRDGHLAPLDFAVRPLPDSLRLVADVRAKVGLFNVGADDLTADFTIVRAPHERAWLLRFQQEPEWRLPLFTRRLLRSPLRRPFEEGGSTVYLGIQDSAGVQTLLSRRTRGVVRESAILRFLNSLGATAMSDFAGKVEVEENRFFAEAFAALQADLRALPDAASVSSQAP